MANTGFKQATIAYKVRKADGAPLDINGQLVSVSGLKQAIALLVGTTNPNPAQYVVEGYFNAKAEISGNPTAEFDPEDCPRGIIFVKPNRVLLSPTSEKVYLTLYSSEPWELLSNEPVAFVSPLSGPAGYSALEMRPQTTEGQGWFIFRNTVTGATARVWVINTSDYSLWVLDTGFWNNIGFWFNDGVWNY